MEAKEYIETGFGKDCIKFHKRHVIELMENYADNRVAEGVKNLTIPVVGKRTFFFDYLGAAYKNEFEHYVADSRTQEIEAYDEEHATLLFKEMHPGKQFDPPY